MFVCFDISLSPTLDHMESNTPPNTVILLLANISIMFQMFLFIYLFVYLKHRGGSEPEGERQVRERKEEGGRDKESSHLLFHSP